MKASTTFGIVPTNVAVPFHRTTFGIVPTNVAVPFHPFGIVPTNVAVPFHPSHFIPFNDFVVHKVGRTKSRFAAQTGSTTKPLTGIKVESRVSPWTPSRVSAAPGRFDLRDVNLFHLHHRIERTLGCSTVRIGVGSNECARGNLPR
jgi:hypothetical protein